MFPELERFRNVLRRVDPHGRFQSDMAGGSLSVPSSADSASPCISVAVTYRDRIGG